MKIGTDAIVLGAWATVDSSAQTILDIGAGTGILSLMMAQKAPHAFVEALEVEENAFEQCVDNFEQSPWSDRLFCFHASLEEFMEEAEDTFDLVICNPPFFSGDIPENYTPRHLARKQQAMPLQTLMESVFTLLSENGVFYLVLPFEQEEIAIALAAKNSLFPNKILHLKGHPEATISRSFFAFTKKMESSTTYESLILETERGQWTEAYNNLTRDFYYHL
jgi:tRNA1Val (adenine37-N6)-methyltransferase